MPRMIPISHFECIPSAVPAAIYESVLAEFAANGTKYMVAGTCFMTRALADAGFTDKILAFTEKIGIRFLGAHSFWGQQWDMNILDPDLFQKMIENQKSVISIASKVNADVLVIHPGDSQFTCGSPSLPAMREQLKRALDILLPYAQKRNIRISLENIIAPSDTPEELLPILEYYHSPSLVCCYDTGHANVMENTPGKDKEKVNDYIKKTLWHDNLQLYSGDTLERLAPYIATAHVHDNDGYSDRHVLPGMGNIRWEKLIPRLLACPNLEFVQNEANWMRDRVSIRETTECFDRLFRTGK